MGLGIPVIGDLIDGVKDIVSEVVVDKDKRDQINYELQVLGDKANDRAHEEILAQIDVNKTEAQSGSLFVAGWRPFVGWVCGVGVGTQAIVLPLLEACGVKHITLDTNLLIVTLGGMLGIGGMRTYEKVKGVSTNDFRDTPVAKPTVTEAPADPVKKKKILGLPINPPW